jgi:hypothetical protein
MTRFSRTACAAGALALVAAAGASSVHAEPARELTSADCNSIGWALSREAEWRDAVHAGATLGERITHSLEWSRLEPLWEQCWALMNEGKIRADFLLGFGSLE